MPRSIQDILDHADDLAKRFEDHEPDPADETSVAELLLRRACLARAQTERQTAEAVSEARRARLSWKRIGKELGISAQGAQQRYGHLAESEENRPAPVLVRGGLTTASTNGASAQAWLPGPAPNQRGTRGRREPHRARAALRVPQR